MFFDGETSATLEQASIVATNDFFLGRFTVTLGAGALAYGSLDASGDPYDLGPGWLGSLGLSWRVLEEDASTPFIVLSTTLGGLGTRTLRETDHGSYHAIDFRFGATVGKTFDGWFSPYASAKLFGGPIFWNVNDELTVGSDQFHIQGSLGAVFVLPEAVDFFVEGSPGGEQAVFGGMGIRY